MGERQGLLAWIFGSGELGDGSCPFVSLDNFLKPLYEKALEKKAGRKLESVGRTNEQISTQEAYQILGLDERATRIEAFTQHQLYSKLYHTDIAKQKGIIAYNTVCQNISKQDLEKRTIVLSRC
jgi:hypothetical protein